MNRAVLILATVLLQAVVGDDLIWVPNSNWENPDNWKLGQVPCGGEVANFAKVSQFSTALAPIVKLLKNRAYPLGYSVIAASQPAISVLHV